MNEQQIVAEYDVEVAALRDAFLKALEDAVARKDEKLQALWTKNQKDNTKRSQ